MRPSYRVHSSTRVAATWTLATHPPTRCNGNGCRRLGSSLCSGHVALWLWGSGGGCRRRVALVQFGEACLWGLARDSRRNTRPETRLGWIYLPQIGRLPVIAQEFTVIGLPCQGWCEHCNTPGVLTAAEGGSHTPSELAAIDLPLTLAFALLDFPIGEVS